MLLTTQEFGAQSLLKGWNTATPAERLSIMESIVAAPRPAAQKKSKGESEDAEGAGAASKSQTLQKFVMAPERRDALMAVLERMHITTGAESFEQRLQNYQTRHLKPIRPSKYQQFLEELLGFIGSPELVIKGWKITHEAFTGKLSELTHRYMKHPQTFPQWTWRRSRRASMSRKFDLCHLLRRSSKSGEHHLKRAALHRVVAQTTISELYTDGVLFKPMVDLYLSNHLIQHQYGRELAMLRCAGVTCTTALSSRSMEFFLERNGMPVEAFCGLENTMPEFRNGIYHMLAGETPEDEDDEFQWRLW
ncbi:hypothetical protein NWF32_03240 [Pseudomonas qingdaonensis]|nr:hypothetical protein [Pseudomonas qingdaonensis]